MGDLLVMNGTNAHRTRAEAGEEPQGEGIMVSFTKYYGAILRQSETAPSLEEARKDFLQVLALTQRFHPGV